MTEEKIPKGGIYLESSILEKLLGHRPGSPLVMHWQRQSAAGKLQRYLQISDCEYYRRARMVSRTPVDFSDLFQSQCVSNILRVQTDLLLFALQTFLGEP